MSYKIGFIIDPLATLNVQMDTSLLLVAEINRRGNEVYYTTVDQLFLSGEQLYCQWRKLEYQQDQDLLGSQGDAFLEPANFCDLIVMRKDPPFDQRYLAVTYLLDYANTQVINSPRGLREANEKLITYRWPHFLAKSIVSNNVEQIAEHIQTSDQTWVIKPLWECGGEGVFKMSAKQFDKQKIKTATQSGQEYVIVQAFLDRVFEGDKRVFLVDGEPLAWVNRMPAKGEFRANLHRGGNAVKHVPNEREMEIACQVGAQLKDLDVPFVGLDIVGDCLTEVNVTSPTCIPEMNLLDEQHYERRLVDYIENRISH